MEEDGIKRYGSNATAISTVAVKSGDTQIVIALLKHKEWLELKVLEVTPTLTHLAETLEESQKFKTAHEDVIAKIKSKTSPVEELYRRAGEVMSKECRPEVYAAMADSLSMVWENVNSHLELRNRLLQLNLDYFKHAELFEDKCTTLERICRSDLPHEIGEMQEAMTRLKEIQREMLVTMSNALFHGNSLLQMITEICDKGTLDSRPAQIKVQAELAKLQVEKWLEGLHTRRHTLTAMIDNRLKDLSQCLGLALITADLTLLRRKILENSESLFGDELGDTAASSQLLLHEHRKLMPTAKEFQEQALKIVKATEEFASEGHFAGPEAISEAYSLLEMAATYIHRLDSREAILIRAVEFFTEAQSALLKLDEIEMELKNQINYGNFNQDQMHSKTISSLDEMTAEPLQMGYNILQQVPSAEGVKRMVEKLENRKINLNVLCTTHKEENTRSTKLYNNFVDKYSQLAGFFQSMDAYLTGMRDMGSDLSTAKDFLQAHKVNSTDLQMKVTEVSALVSLVPSTIENLDRKRSVEVQSMADSLRSECSRLAQQIELRIKLISVYIKVLTLAQELDNELSTIDRIVSSKDGDENAGTQAWLACRQHEAQLKNSANNFIQDIKFTLLSPPLDSDRAISVVEGLLHKIDNRRKSLDTSWTNWLDNKAVAVRNQANWDRIMAASNQTVDWVSKLDAQLYPILNKEIHSARQLACHVEHKVNTVLPEIRRAQQEIQLRIETAEALISKGDVKSSDGVPVRLRDLSNRLHNIASDYQLLLNKLLNFFNIMSQLESRIEAMQKAQMAHVPPSQLAEAERNQADFNMAQRSVTEMLNTCLVESGHIINNIKSLEANSQQDVMTVERAVETLRYDWQKVTAERERTLERDFQRCQFDTDLTQLNTSIDQLSRKLQDSRGRHGDDLPSAQAAEKAFCNFEYTIRLLDEKILEFIKSGEDMLVGSIGDHVERELAALQRRWQLFKQQVVETRNSIEISIKYFTLVEEAQEWFKEGNSLLIGIIQQVPDVKTIEEVSNLLDQINRFLKPGEERQQHRIEEIARLAEKMQMIGPLPHISLVRSGNKDMMDSFSQVQMELKNLLQQFGDKHLIMEIDETDTNVKSNKINLNLDALEPIPPLVTSEYKSTSTVIHKVDIHKEYITIGEENTDRKNKSPTPPLKKVKYVEERMAEAPYFTVPLSDQILQEGSKLRLECRVRGSPEPEIVWEKDGLSTDSNPDYVTTYNKGLCTLSIEETFAEDSARFTCRASNHAGSAETSAFLTVKESEREEDQFAPSFALPLSAQTVTEGEDLTLHCLVRGVPLPTVTWTRGSVQLDDEPSFTILYNNGEATLSKQKVTKDEAGNYTCTANNCHGMQASSASVTVLTVAKASNEGPKFLVGLDNVMARAGQKIKLECQISGIPEPDLIWTHDNKPLNRDAKVINEGGKSSLIIVEAFPKDAGTYTVTAVNAAGRAETTASVTVKGRLPNETSDSEMMPSDAEPIKPTIQLPLKDLSVFEGKKLRLDCVIVGQPEPEVIWYHNDRPVKESADIQLLFQGDRCSLIIRETFLEDAGNYKVVAINSAGEASSSCSLAVQAVDRSTEGVTRRSVESENIASSLEMQESKPHFVKLLSDVQADQGETLVLDCVVGGVPLPTVMWLWNNNDVQQSDRIHMSQDVEGKCNLRISSVNAEDRGVYTARATNQHGEAKCFSHVNVKATGGSTVQTGTVDESVPPPTRDHPPAFTELFADRNVPEGTATKFECIVNGKPTPKIRWLYNDVPVSGKDFLVSTSGNRQVLTMPNVTKALAGKISCVAENDAGRATCAAHLSVSEDLMGLLPSSLDALSSNESSVFEMKKTVFSQSSSSTKFSSTSSSTIGGQQPHVEVKSVSSHSEMAASKIGDKPMSNIESHQTSEYTNIDGVESRHDSQYLTKSGDVGAVSQTKLDQPAVKMIKPQQRKSMPPRFVSTLQGCIVDCGADVTLEAIVEGYPSPSVSWSKNSAPLPADACETTFKLNKAILKLKSVKPTDAGKYSLTAANEAGIATATADVVVKKTSFPPVMGRRLQASTALLGERVSLEIEVTGTPTPSVNWFKDDIPISSEDNRYRNITQGNCSSLIIDKADFSYSGRYSALATNSAGEAKSTADLLIVDPIKDEPASFTSASTEKVLDIKQESSAFGESILKPMLPIFSPGKEGVTVKSESFTSEKQVSMKVERGAYNFQSVVPPSVAPTLSALPQTVAMEPPFKPSQTLISSNIQEESGVIDQSVPKQSALDFFKTIIKENESEVKQSRQEVVENVQTKSWSSNFDSPLPVLRKNSIEKHDRPMSPTFHLEPGPPPEMGFIPKMAAPPPKDDMMDRVKRLQESHRTLSEDEIPSGGVKMYPFPIKKDPVQERPHSPISTVHKMIYPERKKSVQIDYSHKKEIVEEVIVPKHVELPGSSELTQAPPPMQETIQGPVLRPSADVNVRPLSPRPSAEGVSMEKLWSTVHKESSQIEEKVHSFQQSTASSQNEQVWSPPRVEPVKQTTFQPVVPKVEPFQPMQESFKSEMSSQSSFSSVVAESAVPPQHLSSDKPWAPKSDPPHFHRVVPPESKKTTPQQQQSSVMCPSFDQIQSGIRPLSPIPSQQALSMEKQWGHKHVESKLDTTWPPPQISSQTKTEFSSSSEQKSFFQQSFETKKQETLKQVQVDQPAFTPFSLPAPTIEPTQPTIYYVAEAHATHRTNPPPAAEITQTFSSSSQQSSSFKSESFSKQVVSSEDRNILPSQAKKIWPQGPPVTFDTRGYSKMEQFSRRSSTQELAALDDIQIEPGPPPQIGFATPPPKERRQSYVEEIEQELSKNLEKEPTRHLAGAVRTIPPPLKKEKSVEPVPKLFTVEQKVDQKRLYQRSSSTGEDFKPFPQLEPFPFTVGPAKTKTDIKSSTVPRPSKFMMKPYPDSDYESDMDTTKIRARWTPWDSDVEEPTYRRVNPPDPSPKRRPHSVEPQPPPPSAFDKGPATVKSTTTFITSRNQIQSKNIQSESKMRSVKADQNGFALKPGSPPEYVSGKKSDSKPGSPKSKSKAPSYESGYMADTDEPRGFVKQTKTSSFQQTSQQWKSIEKTTQDKFDKKVPSPKVDKVLQPLEPFPFKAEAIKSFKKSEIPAASPSKFVKSEFRESDYESDYESRIKSVWRPSSAELIDPTFRPVRVPVVDAAPKRVEPMQSVPQPVFRPEPVFVLKPGSPPKMDYAPPPRAVETSSSVSFAEATEKSRRVVSMQQTTRVISYDQKATQQKTTVVPHKFVPKGDAKWATSATDSESETSTVVHRDKAEEMRLQRVEDMRKRFGERTTAGSVSQNIPLMPEDPPKFDFAPPQIPSAAATTIANKHMSEMTSTFKSKAHQFASDIMKDVKKTEKVVESLPAKDAPQCYREESRHSERGSKHIDPDTGLIYFKYDFGYEFGVLMPGEGGAGKAKGLSIKDESNKEGSIEVPVIHETTKPKSLPAPPFSTASQQQQMSQTTLGWTSESEMSETEDRRKATNAMGQPNLTIPPLATPPTSLSPSIPSLSPYTGGGPHSHELGGGTNWTSATSGLNTHGDLSQQQRNLGSSPIVINQMLHSDAPKKAPVFITPLRDIAVLAGQTGRFECIVQAEPIPNILWTKDDRIIEPSINHDIMFRNGVCRLTVQHPFSGDQGTYKCTATNNMGTASTTATLKVSGEARTFI